MWLDKQAARVSITKQSIKVFMRYFTQAKILAGILAIACQLLPLISQAEKIWELEETVRRQVGDVHLSMEKNFDRAADLGAFWANAINSKTGVSAIFRGVCAEVIAVQVLPRDIRKLDLDPYLQSKSGATLPIHDVVEVLRKAMSEQCEQLQVMRFVFVFARRTAENYMYEGTLTKANGWRLEDGKVATNFDHTYTFELNYRDVFSVGGMRYKGRCEEQPILELGPQYANNSERALSELPDMGSYRSIATNISPAYVANCPGVSSIRYALNPMPEDYICRDGGDCFLEAQFDSEFDGVWKVDARQFVLKKYNNPISDVKDLYEVLAAGRFDIIAGYESFFGFYIETYFGVYSDHCKNYIVNPVGRTIQSIERTHDGSGFLVKEDFGPVREIFLEREYGDDFDRYFGSSRTWATARMVNSIAASKKRGRGPVDSVYRAVGFFTSNINMLENIVRGNCNSKRLVAAQQNMINFARSQPAITGMFTTTKKVQNTYPEKGSSAPEFSQGYLARRQKSDQVIRAVRDKERAEKTAAKQAIIRAEIAARNAPRNSRPAAPVQTSPPTNANRRLDNPAKQQVNFQTAQAKMQKIIQDHGMALAEGMKALRTKLAHANSNEERLAVQQEFQKFQQEKKAEMQQRMRDLAEQ